ncbi:unnamed protein product, partial [Prorocentrum cordatum]
EEAAWENVFCSVCGGPPWRNFRSNFNEWTRSITAFTNAVCERLGMPLISASAAVAEHAQEPGNGEPPRKRSRQRDILERPAHHNACGDCEELDWSGLRGSGATLLVRRWLPACAENFNGYCAVGARPVGRTDLQLHLLSILERDWAPPHQHRDLGVAHVACQLHDGL